MPAVMLKIEISTFLQTSHSYNYCSSIWAIVMSRCQRNVYILRISQRAFTEHVPDDCERRLSIIIENERIEDVLRHTLIMYSESVQRPFIINVCLHQIASILFTFQYHEHLNIIKHVRIVLSSTNLSSECTFIWSSERTDYQHLRLICVRTPTTTQHNNYTSARQGGMEFSFVNFTRYI